MAGTARGAQGPDLTRSLYVLTDEDGKVLGDYLKIGRPETGMPAFPALPAAQLSDLAAFLRMRAAEGTGRPAMNPANIVVGDAAAGEAYFNGAGGCRTCHSPVGDLKGVGGKYNPVTLQGRMINPRVVTGGRRGAPPPRTVPIQVKVTLAPGQVISGTLVSVDDFFVTLIDGAGNRRTYRATDRQQYTEGRDQRSARGASAADAEVHRRDHAQSRCLPGDAQVKNRTPARSSLACGPHGRTVRAGGTGLRVIEEAADGCVAHVSR